jgi:hypothetical protein
MPGGEFEASSALLQFNAVHQSINPHRVYVISVQSIISMVHCLALSAT